MKYRFINEHMDTYRVATMCRVLRAPRSGFYAWLHQPLSDRAIEDALLMAVLRRNPQQRVLIHSDQGTQFGSDDWRGFCREHNLEPSMSRRGNCWERVACPRGIMPWRSPSSAA